MPVVIRVVKDLIRSPRPHVVDKVLSVVLLCLQLLLRLAEHDEYVSYIRLCDPRAIIAAVRLRGPACDPRLVDVCDELSALLGL